MILRFQVQLLVSESDVENYKQIKSDLDELRLLVEKSELWVYKSKSEGKKEKKKKDGDGKGDDKVEGAKKSATPASNTAEEGDGEVSTHNALLQHDTKYFLCPQRNVLC